MAHAIVRCRVDYLATVSYTDSEGRSIISREEVGRFETEGDAARALAAHPANLRRASWGGWEGAYCHGGISRMLIELPDEPPQQGKP